MQTFGERMIAARREKGMTQAELAAAIRVARNTISSWEHDRTTPDVVAAQRLSEVLDCDLIQYLIAPDEAPKDESVPEPEHPAPVPERRQRHPALPWIIAGAALLACAVLLCLLLTRKPAAAKEPNAFLAEYYQQETPNDPQRAYLSFSNRLWEEKSAGAVYARYAFTMNEHNGKPFAVTRVEVRCQGADGQDRTLILSADDLHGADYDPDIPAYGGLTLDGGFPKSDFLRVGIAVYGEDADGASNVFYDLIEF